MILGQSVPPMVQALLFGLAGVGFWVGGVVVAYYVYRRVRGDDESNG
jgi:hypothetical protein